MWWGCLTPLPKMSHADKSGYLTKELASQVSWIFGRGVGSSIAVPLLPHTCGRAMQVTWVAISHHVGHIWLLSKRLPRRHNYIIL